MKTLVKQILLLSLASIFIISCSEKESKSKTGTTTKKRIISNQEASLAKMLEGRWYNATYFDTLSKVRNYLTAYDENALEFILYLEKGELLKDTPTISWTGYGEGGDDFFAKYNKENNSYDITHSHSNGKTYFSIKNFGNEDSIYCIVENKYKYLFLRDEFEKHRDFMNLYYKAIMEGDYFVKGDSSNLLSFKEDRKFEGIYSNYDHYSLNIFSGDGFHECVTFHSGREYDFKGDFFKYNCFKDSVVLKRVDEYMKPLDSTMVLIPINPAPQ